MQPLRPPVRCWGMRPVRRLPLFVILTATLSVALAAGASAATPFTFDRASPGYAAGLAVDPGGTAFLATSETAGTEGVKAIRIAARRPDGTVTVVRRIAAPRGRTFFEPRVAVARGVATVVWTRQH